MTETFAPPKATTPKTPQVKVANLGSLDPQVHGVDASKIASEPKVGGAGVGKKAQNDAGSKKAITDSKDDSSADLTQLQIALKEYSNKLKNAKSNAEVAITILQLELKKLSKRIKKGIKSGIKSEILHEFVDLLNQTKALFNTKD